MKTIVVSVVSDADDILDRLSVALGDDHYEMRVLPGRQKVSVDVVETGTPDWRPPSETIYVPPKPLRARRYRDEHGHTATQLKEMARRDAWERAGLVTETVIAPTGALIRHRIDVARSLAKLKLTRAQVLSGVHKSGSALSMLRSAIVRTHFHMKAGHNLAVAEQSGETVLAQA